MVTTEPNYEPYIAPKPTSIQKRHKLFGLEPEVFITLGILMLASALCAVYLTVDDDKV